MITFIGSINQIFNQDIPFGFRTHSRMVFDYLIKECITLSGLCLNEITSEQVIELELIKGITDGTKHVYIWNGTIKNTYFMFENIPIKILKFYIYDYPIYETRDLCYVNLNDVITKNFNIMIFIMLSRDNNCLVSMVNKDIVNNVLSFFGPICLK